MGKRWKMVKDSTHANNHKAFIMTKMIQYQRVLLEVMQLDYFKDQPYFNRDYKDDGSEPFLIHSFVSETFYWRIECNMVFEIVIEYCFENCPVEGLVWASIAWHRLHKYAIRKVLNKPLAELHKGTLAFQDPKYINGAK
ncbi:hypothetical protein [Mucilaginibacter pedocola]|nr:hypothetical protein [Mucilaginibacter pedocola]